MNNKNITIILPLHKINDDYEVMFKNALSSVAPFKEHVKVMVVGPLEVNEHIETIDETYDIEIINVINTGSTEYTSQVNLGIEKTETEFFSILEVDDEYNEIWYKSITEYSKYYTDVDVFLPIVNDINVEGNFLNYTNESVWAYGFSDEIGYLDYNTLLEFQNFQLSGGLYRKQAIVDCGGLFKDNIKLTFMYESLLRLTNNKIKIMTVPRIGYTHVNFREDSLFWLIKNDEEHVISEENIGYWVDLAKEESSYNDKREINDIK